MCFCNSPPPLQLAHLNPSDQLTQPCLPSSDMSNLLLQLYSAKTSVTCSSCHIQSTCQIYLCKSILLEPIYLHLCQPYLPSSDNSNKCTCTNVFFYKYLPSCDMSNLLLHICPHATCQIYLCNSILLLPLQLAHLKKSDQLTQPYLPSSDMSNLLLQLCSAKMSLTCSSKHIQSTC